MWRGNVLQTCWKIVWKQFGITFWKKCSVTHFVFGVFLFSLFYLLQTLLLFHSLFHLICGNIFWIGKSIWYINILSFRFSIFNFVCVYVFINSQVWFADLTNSEFMIDGFTHKTFKKEKELVFSFFFSYIFAVYKKNWKMWEFLTNKNITNSS